MQKIKLIQKIQGKVNYLKNDKDIAIESNNANVLVQGNENIIEATKGILM